MIINSIEELKQEIFKEESMKVKAYFATKVVVYFDNMMIFHQKKGLHNNLLDALSFAEKEMDRACLIFKPINLYLIKEEIGYSILVSGLKENLSGNKIIQDLGCKLLQDELNTSINLEKLKFNSWATLLFDFELVNFSQNWINHTPSLEERSKLQAEYILYNMSFKNTEISLVEKINFQENITKHPQYQELLLKVMKIMPKIETSLEQEWRTKGVNNKSIVGIKKNKTGV